MKNILSGNIARYRKEQNLTQTELASKLGITYQAVSKWETEQSIPDTALLPNLAQALNISIDKLFGYSAYHENATYYENTYRNADGYYWGVNPSPMCLKVFSLLAPVPEKPLKLIDIGCGEGKDAVFFARCGYDVSAFDISLAGIEKTKRLADNARVHVNAFKADINDFRLDGKYELLDMPYEYDGYKTLNPGDIEDFRLEIEKNGIHCFL